MCGNFRLFNEVGDLFVSEAVLLVGKYIESAQRVADGDASSMAVANAGIDVDGNPFGKMEPVDGRAQSVLLIDCGACPGLATAGLLDVTCILVPAGGGVPVPRAEV